MLKENWRFVSRLERVGDVLIIVACFFAASYGRAALLYWNDIFGWSLPFTGDELAPLKDYTLVLAIGLLGYLGALQSFGAYSSMRLSTPWRLLRISIVSSVFVFFLLAASLFLLKIDLSRSFIIIFCGLVATLLTAERLTVLRLLRYWRRRGKNFRNIIVCGTGAQAARLAREIALRPELGVSIRAFADVREENSAPDSAVGFRAQLREVGFDKPVKILHRTSAVTRALSEYAVDEVIFTDVIDVMPAVEELLILCSEQGVRTTIAADLFSIGLVKSGLSYFGGMPLIHFQTPPGDRWELTLKRVIDFAGAGILLAVLSPLFAGIALTIKLTSPGSILFRQRRVGLNGRLFYMFKFRSMSEDAEAELEQLKQHNEMNGPVFKMTNDPRITRFGRWLRRVSFDELPQLWNVLIGDMSLVGPRPPVPGEVSLYERRDRRRLSMRPGMTCLWQVSGRNEISDFETWVKLDLEYIDNWSLSLDMVLLLRTIPAVLFGTGAR